MEVVKDRMQCAQALHTNTTASGHMMLEADISAHLIRLISALILALAINALPTDLRQGRAEYKKV